MADSNENPSRVDQIKSDIRFAEAALEVARALVDDQVAAGTLPKTGTLFLKNDLTIKDRPSSESLLGLSKPEMIQRILWFYTRALANIGMTDSEKKAALTADFEGRLRHHALFLQ